MNRQMLRRNGASVYIERGMSFKSFFLNKKDLNSYMCYFIFIFARTVTAEDMIRISASLNFFRLSFCNCLSCVFNFEDLTISFLIGRKRTVKFRNQRLGPHLAADYTIIKSRTLKVSGNHVVYDRGAWFLRVIISSLRTLCRLSSVKKQRSKNRTSRSCFVDPARHRKNSWRKELTNAKRSTKVAKELFADHVKAKKLREPEVFLPV